ncbi:MAG: YolD-like family protein [Bacilli bacterium]|nr:YolD-like family protein [Bacilli bacterium]
MNDRGMVKWAPFNSVINGKEVLEEIKFEKSKVTKPILSEEQIRELEEKIIETYSGNILISIYFYKNGRIDILSGRITKLDPVNKIIIIDNKAKIYFNNIINILEKNT